MPWFLWFLAGLAEKSWKELATLRIRSKIFWNVEICHLIIESIVFHAMGLNVSTYSGLKSTLL
jgi:hypothetical protein